MAYVTARDVGRFVATSSGQQYTNALGNLDDAESLIILFQSSAGGNIPNNTKIQISNGNPALSEVFSTGTGSTGWYQISTSAYAVSSSKTVVIYPVSFRGIRLTNLLTSAVDEVLAICMKQIRI